MPQPFSLVQPWVRAPSLQLPGLDSVSYGPTIRGAHSPDERVQISTVQPFWEATLKILAALADRRQQQW